MVQTCGSRVPGDGFIPAVGEEGWFRHVGLPGDKTNRAGQCTSGIDKVPDKTGPRLGDNRDRADGHSVLSFYIIARFVTFFS